MFRSGCLNLYLRPLSYTFLVLTLTAHVVALCSSHWYGYSVGDKSHFFGIWNICTEIKEGPLNCSFLPSTRDDISTGQLTSIRALFSMAIMLLLGALGYPPFFKQMSTGVLKIGFMALLSAIGGLCSLMGMLITTSAVNKQPRGDSEVHYGYSYFTGWAGTGMAFLTATLIYIASKDNIYSEGNYA